MEIDAQFKKGDFIKYNLKDGEFVIFEGRRAKGEYSTMPRYTALLHYNPSHYHRNENNEFVDEPIMEVSIDGKSVTKTLDTLKEDYWWKLCTPTEKEKCLDIISQYGYIWDEETLSLIDRETGEVLRTLADPEVKYMGQTITVGAARQNETAIRSFVSANTPSSSYGNYSYGSSPYYHSRYNEYDYD